MTRDDAEVGQFEATRIVLAEVAEVLEEFSGTVVVGGSVFPILIPQDVEPHEGTLDVDVVIDHQRLHGEAEITLNDVLLQRLFQQDTVRPFRYTKTIEVGGRSHTVLLELLAGGTPPPNGLRKVGREDVYASVIEGMEVALEAPVESELPGPPPRRVRVASLPALLAMKAVALQRRETAKKPKDAYDIIYCLRNYPGGLAAVAEEVRGALANRLVKSGMGLLAELFASPDALGPQAYAVRADDDEGAALLRREAYERVADLMRALDLGEHQGPRGATDGLK